MHDCLQLDGKHLHSWNSQVWKYNELGRGHIYPSDAYVLRFFVRMRCLAKSKSLISVLAATVLFWLDNLCFGETKDYLTTIRMWPLVMEIMTLILRDNAFGRKNARRMRQTDECGHALRILILLIRHLNDLYGWICKELHHTFARHCAGGCAYVYTHMCAASTHATSLLSEIGECSHFS